MKLSNIKNNAVLGLFFCIAILTNCGNTREVLSTNPLATSVFVKLEKTQARGFYIYEDKENNPEGTSYFQWYRADDENGTNQVKIANATSQTYTYTEKDKGKYLAFEVVPVQKDGQKGVAEKSEFKGKVFLQNDDSETANIELKFLDEYLYPANQMFQGTKIGGLSGIAYQNDTYYIVCDDSKNPRYYKAKIDINNRKISNVTFTEVIVFDKEQDFYSSNFLDLESIVLQNENVIISSEGSINKDKKPSIFASNMQGDFIAEYTIPDKFLTQSRHNGVFESLSESIDNQGIWCANELPLKSDGSEAGYPHTHSPLRFTYYDTKTKQATKEFIYELSPLPLQNTSNNDMNGVSDILEYKENEFLVIERAFQSKNVIRIFKVSVEENSTNSLNMNSLNYAEYIPLKKELIFDFESIRTELTNQKIDNIEGVTFGETLPNGNKTIIFISDDNFQNYGLQLNQFILFELIEK